MSGMPNIIHDVLMVEDDESHAFIIRHCLEKRLDIKLHHAIDGEEALNYFPKDPAEKNEVLPKLVLLDLRMPKMDGLEVLAYIRNISAYDNVPIIIMTSSDAPSDKAKAVELRANGYVTKSFDFNEFKTELKNICNQWLKKMN